MDKAVVTGANGFVGSHLVPLLIEKGFDVHCLVRYTSDISALRNQNVTLHIGDTRDIATLKAPMAGAKYIFHLAARLLVTTEKDFNETNIEGTRNVLEAADRYAKESLARLVFVSSLASAGPNPTAVPYTEASELNPISMYGRSKKQSEAVAHSYYDRLPITIVRPAIVYGEREQDLSQIFPLVESRIQPKLGLTEKLSNGIYVGDLVEGIVAAALSDKSIGETYFLNNAELLTSKSIVQNIGEAMDKKNGLLIGVPEFLIRGMAPISELVYFFNRDRPKMTKDKALEVTRKYWLADPSKAQRDFGWVARHDMVSGLRKTLVPYFAEKKTLREMALENSGILWLKYFLTALALGCIVELLSYIGKFYTFTPGWLIFVIIIGAFGLLFASLAKALRKKSALLQFIVGVLGAGTIELINVLGILGDYRWDFASGWPLGITNVWVRTVVLALPGGIFILLLNTLMRASYKMRLAKEGDRA
nr:NAD-dependent epimerase/dehydratase family protein [uncultured Mucilaginibacter sp.]